MIFLLKSINQWSLPFTKNNWESVFQHLSDLNFDGIELCVAPTNSKKTSKELEALAESIQESVSGKNNILNLNDCKESIEQIRKKIDKFNLKIFSITTLDLFRYTLTSNDPDVREHGKKITKKLIKISNWLNADMVLIEPGVVTAKTSYQDAYKNCINSLKELNEFAARHEVTLALENVWGKFLLSPLEFKDFLDEINSEYIGVYLDVANILPFGYPEDWINILDTKIKNIHFKDFNTSVGGLDGFCNPFDGDVNWVAVKKSLNDIDYAGPITAEVIPPDLWKKEFITEISRKMDFFINNL